MDYGEQIFEDPETHKLVGVNPAAIWHIRICGLNAEVLIRERSRRAGHLRYLREVAISLKRGQFGDIVKLIACFRDEIGVMIPEISAPPTHYLLGGKRAMGSIPNGA